MSNFFILLLTLLLNACSSFHAVSTTELETRELIGQWRSTSGSRLSIYCSGALSYEIKGYNDLIGETNSTCSSCVVNEIQADQLVLGPMIPIKFKISRWPYKDGDLTKMIAEDNTWVRESTKPCQ